MVYNFDISLILSLFTIIIGMLPYLLMNKYYVQPYKKKLYHEKSSYERIRIRQLINKRLKIVRITGGCFLKIGGAILIMLLLLESSTNILWLLILSFIYQHIFNKIYLPISTLNISELFHRNKPYFLYLRGFGTDSYKIHSYKDSFSNNLYQFSEYDFFNLLRIKHKRKKYDFVSVGMTKELECPMGCLRVYLDDNFWKEDVAKLMLHAERIFILINSSESCLWEIVQSTLYREKVTYIIDSETEWLNSINRIPIKFFIEKDLNGKVVFIRHKNGNMDISYKENSIRGYSDYLGITRKYKIKKLLFLLLHQVLIPFVLIIVFIIIEMFLVLNDIIE